MREKVNASSQQASGVMGMFAKTHIYHPEHVPASGKATRSPTAARFETCPPTPLNSPTALRCPSSREHGDLRRRPCHRDGLSGGGGDRDLWEVDITFRVGKKIFAMGGRAAPTCRSRRRLPPRPIYRPRPPDLSFGRLCRTLRLGHSRPDADRRSPASEPPHGGLAPHRPEAAREISVNGRPARTPPKALRYHPAPVGP